ncbi:MAG: DUF262 domain-containing protein [Chitinophagales bacterium]
MKNKLKFLKVSDLYELHNQERLVVDRKYQRASNWDVSMQKLFIDSMLRDYPVPLVYIHNNNDKYYIVDGQQRINAIIAFLENKLKLLSPVNNPKLFPKYLTEEICAWSNKKLNELDNRMQQSFKDLLLTVALIEDAEDKEIRNLFVRLQKGKPLTAQQVRDTSISGINDFILKIAGKNDVQNSVEFELILEGTDGTPNGHEIFNETLKVTKIDRGQARQLASQLLMLYMEMIQNNRAVTINSSNIDDFYLKNIDFDVNSDFAHDFESILDLLYNVLNEDIRLENYELIHLFLLLKKLKDLGLKNYEESFMDAFISFRKELKNSRQLENGEYWTEFGIRTGTNATNSNTIEKRHKFFVDKMIEFMFGGYELCSCELDNSFDRAAIVGNEFYKGLAEGVRAFIPLKKYPYLLNMAKDYFNIGIISANPVGVKPRQPRPSGQPIGNVSKEQLIDLVNECIKEDDRFITEFQKRTSTDIRSLVHKEKSKLTPRSPNLSRNATLLVNGWWMHNNSNNHTEKPKYYMIAKEVIEELRRKSN